MTTMTLNANLNGIELYFDEKPTDAIREAMKNLGFRWHAKKAMWWAKQTPERLALAETLAETKTEPTEEPKAKGKKKASKKAEPKADAPVAEPAPAPKADAPKAKAEPKVTLSELGDKTTYTVVTGKGFETRKGYLFTAKTGRTTVQLGVAKEKDGTWTVTEITTGVMVAGDFDKRFRALQGVDVALVKNVAKALKSEEYQARAKKLEKHNKKASK